MNASSKTVRPKRAAFLFLFCVASAALCACSLFRSGEETSPGETSAPEIVAPLVIPPPPDYANPASWARVGATDSVLPEFEVFYIYPTLFQNKLRPVMDHRFDRIRAKAEAYIGLTFGLLSDPVHPLELYAPFVRQADYSTALETDFSADLGGTLLRYGIEDTKTAFLFFLERLHKPGTPYILIGHSQGASDLYELLKNTPEITPGSGFAAAYLAGLPKKTAAEIERDFEGREVHPGRTPDDAGVILSWNTVSPDAGESIFTVPGGFVVNPLTWTTGTEPADAASVMKNAYYFVSEKEPAGTFSPALLDGAYADPERGALVVDLPGGGPYDADALMGKGVFHVNDIFFFAESIRDDMTRRAAAWRKRYGGKAD